MTDREAATEAIEKHDQAMLRRQMELRTAAALRLLKEVPLEGMILSGDAEFTQKNICQQVTEAGGDCFLVAKENQPSLKEQIEAAFSEPFSPLREADVATGGLHGA